MSSRLRIQDYIDLHKLITGETLAFDDFRFRRQQELPLPARPQPMNLPTYEEVGKDRPPKYEF